MRLRIGVTFVTLLAAMTVLFVWAGMASAATKTTYIQIADPTDPQNTNIPYLAWAGETVKVTKCLNFEGLDASQLTPFSLSGTLNISGWSGTDMAGPNTPFFIQSNSQGLTVTGQWVRDRGLCFSGLDHVGEAGSRDPQACGQRPQARALLHRLGPERRARRALRARLPRHLDAVAGTGDHGNADARRSGR